MLVTHIARVPDPYLRAAKFEAEKADYAHLSSLNNRLKVLPMFKASRSIALRRHDAPEGLAYRDYSMTVNVVDSELRKKFPCIDLLVRWMYKKVDGVRLGRIQVVELEPHGRVPAHKDTGDYYLMHRRFHVPLKTNDKVFFDDGPGGNEAQMLEGQLYRLENRGYHGVRNDGDEYRIHLIVDIGLSEAAETALRQSTVQTK